MTFTGGSWRLEYSISHEELMVGSRLLIEHVQAGRQVRPRLIRYLLMGGLLFVPFLFVIAMTYLDDFLRWLNGEWRTSLIDGAAPSLAAVASLLILIVLMTRPRGGTLSVATVQYEKRDVYHIRAEIDSAMLRSAADGMRVKLDTKGLEDIVDRDGWLLILHSDGPTLLPRRIFTDDEMAEEFLVFIRGLVRRR